MDPIETTGLESFLGDNFEMTMKFYGDSCLRASNTPVNTSDKNLPILLEKMLAIMYGFEGVGLAAPQIGINKTLCVLDTSHQWNREKVVVLDGVDWSQEDASKFFPLQLINPIIVEQSNDTIFSIEGCLSIPDVFGRVGRPSMVTINYHGTDGNLHVLQANQLLGRCLQHEIDHLNGILFFDKFSRREMRRVEVALRSLESKHTQ
jgi:peptide deformylase